MVDKIDKILFATDLSENSRHAFRYAAGEAIRHGASLVLIHVIEKVSGEAERLIENLLGEEKWREMQDTHQRTARDVIIGKKTDYDMLRQALAEFCATAGPDDSRCSFETNEILVKRGNVAEQVLKTAREMNCGLIVIGSHKGLLGRTSVGSVAKSVLHESTVPVLVVPPPPAA
ncbi:MAG: universal stress protein [Deferrisomatales bacterium]|nr:universal stress protein [Deferrisomatales bacterium]